MRKLATLAIAAAATIGLATTAMAGEGVKTGLIDDGTTLHASCHFTTPPHPFCNGDGIKAGSEGTVLSQIGGIGDSEVFFSASWDWGYYDGTSHPCALVDIDTTDFAFDLVPFDFVAWTSLATVTITHKSGAVIDASITGGSVCEIAPGTGGGTINEWNINFGIDGGTKRFADAGGTGTIHFLFDSGPSVLPEDAFPIFEILVHMD